MGYRIGSFNLRDLNYSNKANDGEELARNFKKIADIIASEQLDVVGLQELNSESALHYLTSCLNKKYSKWESIFGTGMPTHLKDPERYGFIWNTRRLRLLKVKRGTNPAYYTNAGGTTLIRPPYYGRFTSRGLPGGTNIELRLVNVHIKAGNIIADRRLEFAKLVQQILPRICDHQEVYDNGETMPSYTFLLGDYNICLGRDLENVTETTYTGRRRVFKTVQHEKTSLRWCREQQTIEECYANDFDHFSYEIELENKIHLCSDRVEALSKYYPDESCASEVDTNFGFLEYKEKHLSKSHYDAPYMTIAKTLGEIVQTQSPVHMDVAFRQLAPLYGNEKVTQRIKDDINKVIVMYKQQYHWKKIGEFLWMTETPIKPRYNTDLDKRTLDQIAIEELGEAMKIIVDKSYGIDKDTLFRVLTKAYGFGRVSAAMESRLNQAFDKLKKSKSVLEIEGKLKLKNS